MVFISFWFSSLWRKVTTQKKPKTALLCFSSTLHAEFPQSIEPDSDIYKTCTDKVVWGIFGNDLEENMK